MIMVRMRRYVNSTGGYSVFFSAVVRKLPPYGYCDIPKREKTQPTTEPFAQMSLDQNTGEISVQNSTWPHSFKSRR